MDILAKHTQAFSRDSYDVLEFLTAGERLRVLIESVPYADRCFFAVCTLLGPEYDAYYFNGFIAKEIAAPEKESA